MTWLFSLFQGIAGKKAKVIGATAVLIGASIYGFAIVVIRTNDTVTEFKSHPVRIKTLEKERAMQRMNYRNSILIKRKLGLQLSDVEKRLLDRWKSRMEKEVEAALSEE